MGEQEEKYDKQYLEKYNSFIQYIPTNHYFFEVTKLCGYGEFFMINKRSNLLELYKNIGIQFQCENLKRLFIKNENTLEEILIPNTEMTIFEYISNNYLKPIYELPTPVVYRIYIDYD